MSNDIYNNDTDKEEFIKKYYKKGFSHLNIVKKDQSDIYKKKYSKVMR